MTIWLVVISSSCGFSGLNGDQAYSTYSQTCLPVRDKVVIIINGSLQCMETY